MPNIREYQDELLVAFGGTAVGGNEEDFRVALVAAVTAFAADKVSGLTIVAMGGALAASGNDTMTDIANIATAGGATPTATQVDTAVNGAITEIELNFADIQDKLNELITAIA